MITLIESKFFGKSLSIGKPVHGKRVVSIWAMSGKPIFEKDIDGYITIRLFGIMVLIWKYS